MLENTKFKLHHKKDFIVGYFGGSITCGACASNAEFSSWRGLSKAWLREAYPDVRVHELYACIGGTGTELGAYRCDHDVCEQNPDLVFVEFATNDNGCQGNYDRILAQTEAIVRKILKSNPTCDVVMVYTNTGGTSNEMIEGRDNTARTAHATVGYHYHLPQIDFSEPLRARIIAEGGDWKKYTADTVHPNDDGHRIMFECLKSRMIAMMDKAPELERPIPVQLPAPLLPVNPLLDAHMIDACALPHSPEWISSAETLQDVYPHYLECDRPGAWLTVPFIGSRIGVYWMMGRDSGKIRFRIDGGEWRQQQSFDSYCLHFERPCSMMLAEKLPYAEHTMELEIIEEKPQDSVGTRQRIGAFLVC